MRLKAIVEEEEPEEGGAGFIGALTLTSRTNCSIIGKVLSGLLLPGVSMFFAL